MRLMAKPERAFPNMDTTDPSVIMVKSRVQSFGAPAWSEVLVTLSVSAITSPAGTRSGREYYIIYNVPMQNIRNRFY